MTFFIGMFVFFMMFIFKYIDDFVGKGLGFKVLGELFFWFSFTTIPMALPLAVLLSSLMTFGNLGEHFELSAMKSSGLSLQKIMRPLIITTICLSIAAFYFSNNVLPYTNLKVGRLLYDVRESKPALIFKEGMFNNGLDGFSIRIGEKDKDNKTLRNVLIYDHRAMQGNNIVLTAREGEMMETPDKMFLVLTLRDGCSYKDIMDSPKDSKTRPMIREKFQEKVVRYDLSEFKMMHTNEDLFRSNYQMLNLKQLNNSIDSMQMKNDKRVTDFAGQLQRSYYTKSFNYLAKLDSNKVKSVSVNSFDKFTKPQKSSIIDGAINIARSAKQYADSIAGDYDNAESLQYNYMAEWHRKFTLSIACIVLFFIGAPLGAIIRKGGLGMPVVISLIFFITFHILSITGEKLVKEGKMPPYQGMWMATVILLPIGIFLTYKATSDSSLFDLDAYINPIKKLFVRKKSHEKTE
jgi:lipopolysaccharide export system permease protein